MIKKCNHYFAKLLADWSVSSSSGLHLNCLDGLRGVAIIMVVFFHGIYFNPKGNSITILVGKLAGAGWMGVPIFFVISGFLISYPFFKGRLKTTAAWYTKGYATRRVLKIFQPFYFSIVILIIFYFVQSHDFSFITLGLKWATGYAHYIYKAPYFDGPYWSLWVELHFYLVLPVLFFLFRKASYPWTCWGIFGLLFLIPYISRFLTWPENTSPAVAGFTMWRFPNQLDCFAWGVILAGLFVVRNHQNKLVKSWSRFGYWGGVMLLASIITFAFVSFPERMSYQIKPLITGLAAFLLLFFVFDPATLGARILSFPALRFVGVISYEWFLIHDPVLRFFRHDLIGSTKGSFGLYLFTVFVPILLTFIASALIYRYISLPIMRWGRRMK